MGEGKMKTLYIR